MKVLSWGKHLLNTCVFDIFVSVLSCTCVVSAETTDLFSFSSLGACKGCSTWHLCSHFQDRIPLVFLPLSLARLLIAHTPPQTHRHTQTHKVTEVWICSSVWRCSWVPKFCKPAVLIVLPCFLLLANDVTYCETMVFQLYEWFKVT